MTYTGIIILNPVTVAKALAKSFPLEDSPSFDCIAVPSKLESQIVQITNRNRVRYAKTCPIIDTLKTTINGEIRIGAIKSTIRLYNGILAMNEPIKTSRVFTL